MNLPNRLTIFRMLLVIVILLISVLKIDYIWNGISISLLIIDLIFIIASITDYLDGHLARKNNQITNFGKFLDPIADKILVIVTMIILVELGKLPAWIPSIIILREFMVSGYRLVIIQKDGKVIAANMWGKVKTVTQMIAIILAFIDINGTNIFLNFIKSDMSILPLIINILTSLMFIICTFATIVSGWIYIKDWKEVLKD